jgi:hypothetical protein
MLSPMLHTNHSPGMSEDKFTPLFVDTTGGDYDTQLGIRVPASEDPFYDGNNDDVLSPLLPSSPSNTQSTDSHVGAERRATSTSPSVSQELPDFQEGKNIVLSSIINYIDTWEHIHLTAVPPSSQVSIYLFEIFYPPGHLLDFQRRGPSRLSCVC